MEKKSVDARGELCPKPLIMTKKAIKGYSGEIDVLLDNATAVENVTRFLKDNGVSFQTEGPGEDGVYKILINSDGDVSGMSNPAEYCTIPVTPQAPGAAGSDHIICFKSNKMGTGAEELGSILIQAFCNTIKEVEPLPKALVFYNSGVSLALEDSPVVESLRELEAGGMKILVCGTCADYFGVKEKVAVGIVSNMYDIMECLTGAGKIVSP